MYIHIPIYLYILYVFYFPRIISRGKALRHGEGKDQVFLPLQSNFSYTFWFQISFFIYILPLRFFLLVLTLFLLFFKLGNFSQFVLQGKYEYLRFPKVHTSPNLHTFSDLGRYTEVNSCRLASFYDFFLQVGNTLFQVGTQEGLRTRCNINIYSTRFITYLI